MHYCFFRKILNILLKAPDVLKMYVPTHSLFLRDMVHWAVMLLRSLSPTLPSSVRGPQVTKLTCRPPPIGPASPFDPFYLLFPYKHICTHIQALFSSLPISPLYILKSASLRLTSSRLLMNKCFRYLSFKPPERGLGRWGKHMSVGKWGTLFPFRWRTMVLCPTKQTFSQAYLPFL